MFKNFKFNASKWFTWHLLPSKDYSILSIYEFLIYVFLFYLCFWTYSKVNSITTHSYTIETECLNVNKFLDNSDFSSIPSAKIEIFLPMTKTFKDSANNVITLKTYNPNKEQKDRFLNFLVSSNTHQNKRDSLTEEYYQNFKKEDKETSYYLYYIKTNHVLNNKLFSPRKFHLHRDSIGEEIWKGKYIIKQRSTDTEYFQEIYNLISSSKFIENRWDFSETGGLSMSNPGWFADFDISQAYYDIRLKSTTIDSLTLEINFVGATNFSRMIPEPDVITMSSIRFIQPEKLCLIKEKGLQFHATFAEMKNRQTIRLFFLTTIMCSLLSLLMIFTIIGFYKVIYELKINRQGDNKKK